MIDELEAATPASLTGPSREAMFAFTSAPPWRRAEPGEDPALVEALADDLAHWVETCGAA